MARDLAFEAGSTWRRLVTDPRSGQLLDYGRTTYRPPVGLAEFVKARDMTCRTPTCTRPATNCHLDHVISWPAGATSQDNLQAKCDHDHRLKHEGRWRHQASTDPRHPPGTIIITSPTGHVYLSHRHVYTEPIRRNPAPKPPVAQEQSEPGTEQGPSKLRANKDYLTGTDSTAQSDDDSGPPPF
jgi:hypothetical protein